MNDPSSAQRNWIIAVDGGGSKIAIAAAPWPRAAGDDMRTWHFEGTGSAHPSTWPQAAENLSRAIVQVVTELQADKRSIAGIKLALAGAGRPDDQHRVVAMLQAGCPNLSGLVIECMGDIEPLVDYHAEEMGCIAVILGTGSVVASRHDNGTLVRAGGWGPMLGDACSGGAIGLSALRYLTQLIDEGQTLEQFSELALTLAKEVRNLYGDQEVSLNSLLIQTASNRTQTAQLAGVVLDRAYRLGDRDAGELLEPHLADIVWQIRQVARHANLNDQPIQLNFSGGIAQHHPDLRHAIMLACNAAGLSVPCAELVQPLAAILNMRKAAIEN